VTQKQTVLRLLEARGFKGVGVHELIYQHGITRAAAIVHDLKGEGIDIDTVDEGDGKLARYVLHAANEKPPVPCSCGHRLRAHVSGFKCLEILNPDDRFAPVETCPCEKFAA
jgi:hypothetical protein